MIYAENTSLQAVSLHIVGNKSLDEGVFLSESSMPIVESLRPVLTQYFTSSFKSDERFCFFHHSGLEFNFVYKVVSGIFSNPASLHQASVMLANQLYEQSEHSKIKGGEFCVAYFKEVEVNGIKTDAVGLFKSENKDTYLKVVSQNGSNGLEQETGINVNKLDKAALIFNTDVGEGYRMAIIDNTNRTEAKYWVDDFLQAKPCADEYQHTRTFLNATKAFITKELPATQEVSRGEQAELMDKALRYFKENDTFAMDDFNQQVMGVELLSADFGQYVDDYMAKNDLEPAESFAISESAVKKSQRSMKSVIKLDRNFHIYVHGGEGMIKKGYDEETGMEYYQLYFKKEE